MKAEQGSTYRYLLTDGQARYGYIYDGPPKPGRARNQVRVTGFKSEREAIVALHGAVTKQETGVARPITDPDQTLSELFAYWINEYPPKKKLGRKTVKRYKELAEDYVLPRLGNIPVSKLDLYAFEEIFDNLGITPGKRGRPLSAKTIREVHSVFHNMFNRAIKRYKMPLKVNPVVGCDLPKVRKRKVQSLEPEEIRRFAVQTLKEKLPWLRPLAALAAGVGPRRGEMLAARWPDINWDGHTLWIDKSLEQVDDKVFVKSTKEDEEHLVPLPPFVIRELKIHRDKQQRHRELFGADYRTDLDLIFCEPDGNFLKPDSVTAKVCVIMKKLGIRGSLHSLRHSQASELFDEVPLTTIAKRLGHSNTETTSRIYSHALRREDRKAADVVERKMGEAFDRTRIN
jgi:integrase